MEMNGDEMTKNRNIPTTQDSNKNGQLDLYDTLVNGWECMIIQFKSEKQKKLAHYLAFGLNPRQAALRSGYSKRFANSGVYELLKINKDYGEKVGIVRKNFRESYIKFSENVLPDIAWIERRELEELIKNPDRLNAVNARLMRDLKRSAGVLDSEYKPQINVNIGYVRKVMQAQTEGKKVTWEPPDEHGMCKVTIHKDEKVVDVELDE
jgi:hypothetical protein